MRTQFFAGAIFFFAVLVQTHAQDVEITRGHVGRRPPSFLRRTFEAESATEENVKPAEPVVPARAIAVKKEIATSAPAKPTVAQRPAKLTIEQMLQGGELAAEKLKKESQAAKLASVPVAPPTTVKTTLTPLRLPERQVREPEPPAQFANFSGQTAFIRLADGFDFPVGKPDAKGYYKARGFRVNGHLGEDWDGVGGGDTDLGDPIYCIGDGVVVFARDCHMGWGNVIIVRHAYRENGMTRNDDSLYGHHQKILVRHGQKIRRGEQIATLGNAHGIYDEHIPLEVR